MRDALKRVRGLPQHPGLALATYAPVGPDGKIPEADRQDWLAKVAAIKPPAFYGNARARWEQSVAHCHRRGIKAETSLLIGAGLPSAVDVGMQLHRVYGVPFLPGSALKGLLAHYLDGVYGPAGERADPRDPTHPDPARARFQAAVDGLPAGELYEKIFGCPDVEGFPAAQGTVVFLDALPESADDSYLQVDVLTVHQKDYYAGKSPANDHCAPNPVSYLSVRPGTEFLIVLDTVDPDDAEFARLALDLLLEALAEWGIGAKTSSGLGRFTPGRQVRREVSSHAREMVDTLLAGLGASLPSGKDVASMKAFLAEHLLPGLRSCQPGSPEERGDMIQKLRTWLARESGCSDNARQKVRPWLEQELAHLWPET